jgi:hypothetical protein
MEGNAIMEILVLKEKHGERYFAFNTPEDLYLIARFIVAERIDEECYVDEQDKRVLGNLNKVVLYEDGKAAMAVLQARNDWEYEGFEIVSLETVKGITL